jgi:hypothetical protein
MIIKLEDTGRGAAAKPAGGLTSMHRLSVRIILSAVLAFCVVSAALAETEPLDPSHARGPVRPLFAHPNAQNRVTDVGKMRMNITNHGYLGNAGPGQSDAVKDPCPPNNWADQCEYPAGSGQEYLFQAGLWIGALIVDEGFETKRVSVGTDGWLNPAINEFWPGEGAANGIVERSTRPGRTNCLGDYVTSPDAISDEDFICSYSDTLTDQQYVVNDPIDGTHRPLGIKVTQKTYAFSQAFAEDFILIDYTIENIASNFLKNLYVGLYVDADVGRKDMLNQHTDDICGFSTVAPEKLPNDSINYIPINTAWIADNDGRDPQQTSGPLIVPNVTGTRVIRGPNPRLKTSFNWWISNSDVALDYGPSWEDYCARDSMGMGWTKFYGTPMGDERKYEVLSNSEFDFWQIMVDKMAQVPAQDIGYDSAGIHIANNKAWCTADPSPDASDIADGYDTRYLLSWGPLGIYDYTDASGRRIYRLNPGEKFNMTIAYVGGQNFHDPTHPQPSNTNIDSSLFNFSDLWQNARWAQEVYDNRMRDTYMWDTNGDGIPDAGDGWSGEDVGTDGVYPDSLPPSFQPWDCSTNPPTKHDSVAVYYFKGSSAVTFAGWYYGPDCDGTERNGRIDVVHNTLHPEWTDEDHIIPDRLIYHNVPRLGDWDMGWMTGNGMLDQGDGIPDFTGPPPPPIPALMDVLPNTTNAAGTQGGVIKTDKGYLGGIGYELRDGEIILRWSKKSSESKDYVDPFSRVQDFEAYKIVWANINQDEQYNYLADFDKIDFAYFTDNDSMMTVPVDQPTRDSLVAAGKSDSTILGVTGHLKAVGNNTGFASIMMNDSIYEYHIKAKTLWPRYYAVVARDFGDPHSGLGPLETRPTANSVLLAPAGSSKDAVRVVPNPYRAYEDYTTTHGGSQGSSWENQNDGTTQFYPQVDRRLEFMNLPDQCLIRVFTVAGDLVQIIPHNTTGDKSHWASLNSERWDLNSRNRQQVVSGIYLFSVEDLTPGNGHKIETGKFVIIR